VKVSNSTLIGQFHVPLTIYRDGSDTQMFMHSARLKLITDMDEDGGELLSDCDNGDSMARAGAVANSRFIIVMDDD
jgi:hypothetical protein